MELLKAEHEAQLAQLAAKHDAMEVALREKEWELDNVKKSVAEKDAEIESQQTVIEQQREAAERAEDLVNQLAEQQAINEQLGEKLVEVREEMTMRIAASEDERGSQRTHTDLIEQIDAKDAEIQRLTQLLETQGETKAKEHEAEMAEIEAVRQQISSRKTFLKTRRPICMLRCTHPQAHEAELKFLMSKLDELEEENEAIQKLNETRATQHNVRLFHILFCLFLFLFSQTTVCPGKTLTGT